MKILIVTPFVPSHRTAGQNYTLQLIEDLAKDHRVDVAYFRYTADTPYTPPGGNVRVVFVREISTARKFLNALKLPLTHPLFSCRFDLGLVRFLRRHRQEYDQLYFDFSQTFVYSLHVSHGRKILMVHDVILQKYARGAGIVNALNRLFCSRSERRILEGSGGTILCFSDKDRGLLESYYGLSSRKVDFFIHRNIRRIDYGNLAPSGAFLFFGAWERPENAFGLEWFVDHVMASAGKAHRILILGSGIPEKLREKISRYPTMEMTGFVDDPYPVLAAASGLIAPLFHGAGVKVKVLEALACGTPVLGTDVAFEGIDMVGEGACIHCRTPEEFLAGMARALSYSMEDKKALREAFIGGYPKDTFREFLKCITSP
jgi:glycosyltransferase involved in cell wall biosynthesis